MEAASSPVCRPLLGITSLIRMAYASQIPDKESDVLRDIGIIVSVGDVRRIMSDSNLMVEHGLEVPQKFSASN